MPPSIVTQFATGEWFRRLTIDDRLGAIDLAEPFLIEWYLLVFAQIREINP